MTAERRILPTLAQGAGDAPPDAADGEYTIGNNNRWSRIALSFQDLMEDTWCEFSVQITWHPNEENRGVHDFAVVGLEFMANDGSSIDFAHVPGLTRTQIDPHSSYVAGPDYLDQGSRLVGSGQVRFTFLLPSPAKRLLVTIRSWRNSHPFKISHPCLRQIDSAATTGTAHGEHQANLTGSQHSPLPAFRNLWKTLTAEPRWFSYALVPGRRLFVRGQVINRTEGTAGALVRVIYRDSHGDELPAPYPETISAPGIGAFVNIPTPRVARRFTLELVPPPQAVTVDLGFQAWRDEEPVELVTPLEMSLEDDLLLETISGEDPPDAPGFLNRLSAALTLTSRPGAAEDESVLRTLLDQEALSSPVTVLDRLKLVRQGERVPADLDRISLGSFSAWPLPQEPTWTEDPFQSPAWRLEFHSLSWLLDIARSTNPSGLERALDLAVSWSKANPWGSPADVISAHPLSLAVRAETLLQLLSLGVAAGRKANSRKLLVLFAEAVRHCFALAEILGQNIFSHSVNHLYTASALLSLSRAVPRIPLSPYWTSIALAHLRDGFGELLGPDGSSIEKSPHYRLEIISIGLVLSSLLKDLPAADELRQQLAPCLKEGIRSVIMVIDPAGMLPMLGDTVHGHHHASWLRRLIAGYGQELMADQDIAAELSYPRGSRVIVPPGADMLALRHYERKPDWGYLCASLTGQRHEHGHFDCTSFTYAADGVRWIADPGGSGLHDMGPVRQFLVSSRAHNIALPDGRDQTAGNGWIKSRLSLEDAEVFEIATDVHGPDYIHRRVIACLRDLDAVAVIDRFVTSKTASTFEGFLHFEPDVTVAIVNPRLAVGFHKKNRLRIIPRTLSGSFNGLTLENGRNDRPSSMQGFVSRRPGVLDPANVLRYTFSGRGTISGGVILGVTDLGLRTMSDVLERPAIREILELPPG